MSNELKLPAGTYYIGDPCYVIHDWGSFCDVWFENTNSVFDYDGHDLCAFYTKYGDGSYEASDGSMLGVDAGMIGAVPAVLMTTGDFDMGTEVHFDKPFTCRREGNGKLHFGDFTVMTGDDDEDYDYES